MILTNCAACAAPLAHNAPRCVRCHTRYCHATCQHDHWRRGHKQICKKIRGGGKAEQYHANKKYKEAVAVAVEACRERIPRRPARGRGGTRRRRESEAANFRNEPPDYHTRSPNARARANAARGRRRAPVLVGLRNFLFSHTASNGGVVSVASRYRTGGMGIRRAAERPRGRSW